MADIGIHSSTTDKITQARVAAWTNLLSEWKAVGKEWDKTYAERKSLDIPFTDPKSKDIWVQMAAAQSKSIDEAIDLSWIDMNAADPKHYKAAHRNARLSPIWTREEHIEMDGLFARGCLIKRNRRDLPADARIIGSRYVYKFKRHHSGRHRNKATMRKKALFMK